MKILLPISSLCVGILVAATMFTSCQKEAQLVPTIATEHASDNTVTDRTTPIMGISFTATNNIDVQYRVTNAAGTNRYYTKYWYDVVSGNTSSNVPGLDPCPRVEIRGRLLHPNPGNETISWTFNRTTCSPVNGTASVTAPSNTPWSNIPWQIVKEAACECN